MPWDPAALNTPGGAPGAGGGGSRSIRRPPRTVTITLQLPSLRKLCVWLYGRLNWPQRLIVATAALILAGFVAFAVSASSRHVQDLLRSCDFCKALNCIEISGWWSCCMATLPGSCVLELQNDLIFGVCNVTGLPIFNNSCSVIGDSACSWDPTNNPTSTSTMCRKLCFDC